MSDSMEKLIKREELLEALENYNRTKDASCLQQLFTQLKKYMEQSDMRRQQLKQTFRDDCTLEQVLSVLALLPSATDYYLMGCYLLAQCPQRHWDASEILAAMKANCDGCISWLSENQKDFIGRIALHQASSFLTKEQLIQAIQLLDGYFLRQDILNRIVARDEPKSIAIVRQRIVGEQPATVRLQPSEQKTLKYRNIDDAEAFALFENDITAPLDSCLQDIPDEGLTEPDNLIDRVPDAELLKLFALIKNENLESGIKIMHLLLEINNPFNENFSEYKNGDEYNAMAVNGKFAGDIEDVFLSFIEYSADSMDNWFDEAWKVLCRIGQSDTVPLVALDTFSENKEAIPFASSWHIVNRNADERIARLECYLVKLLRIAIQHGTSEQIAKVLSFLTPGALARHASRLAAIDIPMLYSVLMANGYSNFALHTVIATLDWSSLSFNQLSEIAPCMLDDTRFLTNFLKNYHL